MANPLSKSCGKCGAEPGCHCVGSRGNIRKAFHRCRYEVRDSRAPRVRRRIAERTESPIEKLLVDAVKAWLEHFEIAADVTTQAPIGVYRADVLIETEGRKLVVECDGAAFHSSPQQIARDKRRDRFCAANGLAVMRFTGSEIVRDPRGCAAQICQWVQRS